MCKRSRSFYIFSAVTYFSSYFRSKKNQFAVLYFFFRGISGAICDLQSFAKYFGKNSEIKRVRQRRKNFISVFAHFFSASATNLFLQGRLDTRLCLYAVLWFC